MKRENQEWWNKWNTWDIVNATDDPELEGSTDQVSEVHTLHTWIADHGEGDLKDWMAVVTGDFFHSWILDWKGEVELFRPLVPDAPFFVWFSFSSLLLWFSSFSVLFFFFGCLFLSTVFCSLWSNFWTFFKVSFPSNFWNFFFTVRQLTGLWRQVERKRGKERKRERRERDVQRWEVSSGIRLRRGREQCLKTWNQVMTVGNEEEGREREEERRVRKERRKRSEKAKEKDRMVSGLLLCKNFSFSTFGKNFCYNSDE